MTLNYYLHYQIWVKKNDLLKGLQLMSGRVTHLKRKCLKKCFLVVNVWTAWQSILWYRNKIMSVISWQFWTCICWFWKSVASLLPVQQIHSVFNLVAKSIEDIILLRYHKTNFDTLNLLVTRKYRFSKKPFYVYNMTVLQWSSFKCNIF